MIVSGIDLSRVSQSALSSACSLGFILKFTVFERVSGSPRRLARPFHPVSGAFGLTATTSAVISSIGLGENADKASDRDGLGAV